MATTQNQVDQAIAELTALPRNVSGKANWNSIRAILRKFNADYTKKSVEKTEFTAAILEFCKTI